MAIGVIRGRRVTVNKDGDKPRILAQVQMLEDDVRTVELIGGAGDDTNPGDGCRVVIGSITPSYKVGMAVTDDLTPEVSPGEREIYSTDSPVTQKKARIKLTSSGDVVINQGTENAARVGDTVQVTLSQADIVALATVLLATGAFVPTFNPPAPAGPVILTDGEITSGTSEVLLP